MLEIQDILGEPSKISRATDSIEYRFDIYRYFFSDTGKCDFPDWQIQFLVDPATDKINLIHRGR
jgi:hypothetical protein